MKQYREEHKKDRKEYMKQWCKNNPEKLKENKKQYCKNHPEKVKKYNKQYRKDNPEYIKQYQKDNAEHTKEYKKQWLIDNPEYFDQWRKTEAGKRSIRKKGAKRRQLGFIPLNEPFEGSVAHHISENFVIYMPTELHQSLRHNIWTWKNMEQMNKLAIECL